MLLLPPAAADEDDGGGSDIVGFGVTAGDLFDCNSGFFGLVGGDFLGVIMLAEDVLGTDELVASDFFASSFSDKLMAIAIAKSSFSLAAASSSLPPPVPPPLLLIPCHQAPNSFQHHHHRLPIPIPHRSQ